MSRSWFAVGVERGHAGGKLAAVLHVQQHPRHEPGDLVGPLLDAQRTDLVTGQVVDRRQTAFVVEFAHEVEGRGQRSEVRRRTGQRLPLLSRLIRPCSANRGTIRSHSGIVGFALRLLNRTDRRYRAERGFLLGDSGGMLWWKTCVACRFATSLAH